MCIEVFSRCVVTNHVKITILQFLMVQTVCLHTATECALLLKPGFLALSWSSACILSVSSSPTHGFHSTVGDD